MRTLTIMIIFSLTSFILPLPHFSMDSVHASGTYIAPPPLPEDLEEDDDSEE